ncbi:hypothetical protein K8Q98_02075 [Candidatus Nomurabacteria bacterium]|nr:hypothetical protein [Candidatus Nomurabacteria bacterium]
MIKGLKNRQGGFFGLIKLLIILVLSYFQISIRSVVESPTGQDNIEYVGDTSRNIWVDYLKAPFEYLWNDVWIDIFWEGFLQNMRRIRDGNSTEFDNASPEVFDTAPNWGL